MKKNTLNGITSKRRVSLVAQMIKNLPAMQESQVRSQGQEDSLEKGMATHSNILTWRIPWTEEPGGIQSMGSQRVGQDWATNTRKGTCVRICLYACNQHKRTTDILSDFLRSWSILLLSSSPVWRDFRRFVPDSDLGVISLLPGWALIWTCPSWCLWASAFSGSLRWHPSPTPSKLICLHPDIKHSLFIKAQTRGHFLGQILPIAVSFSFILHTATSCRNCSISKSCPTLCDPIRCHCFHFFLLFAMKWWDQRASPVA